MQAEVQLTLNDGTPTVAQTQQAERTLADRGLRTMWWINLAGLVGLGVWAYLDARFSQTAYSLKSELNSFLGRGGYGAVESPLSPGRLQLLRIAAACAGASGLVLFAALFVGPRGHRRMRSWLLFVAAVAGWLAMWVNWPDIAWLGQQRRLAADLSGFEKLAQSLRDEFPKIDGERAEFGPFMAYPVGQPSMLMLLTTPQVSQSGIAVTAVERSPDGGLCFQLAGTETGGWLEWHPPGCEPASFLGGLVTTYNLQRSSPLGNGWFLVSYRETKRRKQLISL